MPSWVFDLDNTLVDFSDELNRELDRYIEQIICRELCLEPSSYNDERARLLLNARYPYTPVVFGQQYTKNWSEFAQKIYDQIPFSDLPIRPTKGIEALNNIPGKKYILTNSPLSLAAHIIGRLPLHENTFCTVFGLSQTFPYQKPSADAFIQTGIRRCIFIDDSLLNVRAAQNFGWHAFHFSQQNEPSNMFSSISDLQQLLTL